MKASLLQSLRFRTKKEYLVMSLFFVLMFCILVAGQMIAVVGNKQIIEPMTITVVDVDGAEIPSVRRFMQLARAGNYTMILPSTNVASPYLVEGVFLKKLFVGIADADVSRIDSLDIFLGEMQFHFDDVTEWNVFDKSLVQSELYGLDYDTYTIYEVPEEVSLARSQIPVYSSFFGSLINWSGDSKVFLSPLLASVSLVTLLLVFGVIAFRLYYSLQKTVSEKNVSSNGAQVRRDWVEFCIVLLLTICSLCLLNVVIYVLYNPDIAHILKESSEVYLSYFHKSFRPKPVERLQFILSTLAAPFLLWGYYVLVAKKYTLKDALVKRVYPWVVAFSLIALFALVYLGLAMSGFFFIRDSFFFDGAGRYVYTLLLFPYMFGWFIKSKVLSRQLVRYVFALLIAILGVVFFMNIFAITDAFDPYTSDPVLYPITQVMAGKSLLVNLTSFYGLYPLVLLPVFSLVGLSVLKFSVVMSVLICFSVVALFVAMREIIANKVLFYAGFITTIFYTLLATRTMPEQYLQYWPIRYVFPCLSILLVVYYFKNKQKVLYYLSFLLFAVGVLWNFDVGIVVFIAWLGVLVYNEISTNDSIRNTVLRVLKHGLVGVISLLFTIGMYCVITYMQSGLLPDASLWLQYQEIFLTGYLMIKMIPPPHMWTVVILVYLVGLLISAIAFSRKQVHYLDIILFYLSVLGFGLFSYYEGQSTDVTLFRTSYPAIILLVMFADMLWKRIHTYGKQAYGESVLFLCIFFVLVSAPVSVLFNVQTYESFVSQGVSAFSVNESNYFDNIAFLKEHTELNESVLILSSPDQAIYYAETGTRSIVDTTSLADIPFPEEMDRLIDFLNTNDEVKVFAKDPISQYTVFDERIEPLLTEQYIRIAESGYGFSQFEKVIK